MNITKVDVSVNYYGKPYQTIVTLLTLCKYSRQHIENIYLVVEKQQPFDQYGEFKLLKWALKDLPVHYYFPDHFYYHGSPPIESLNEADKRYGLKYQYGLEKTDKVFHFLSHNDCLYKADLLGMMLQQVKKSEGEVAGVGMIGQCWNCPALFAQVCDRSRLEQFHPSAEEYLNIMEQYPVPMASARKAIHYNLIKRGYTYPLPECRLNEYACLVNANLYQQLTQPRGVILPLGAAWHGTDWGTVWFYSMVNAGYKFIHFPFEPHMAHAPFTPAKSGHVSDHDSIEYYKNEENAQQYLQKEFPAAVAFPLKVRLAAMLYPHKVAAQRFSVKVKDRILSF